MPTVGRAVEPMADAITLDPLGKLRAVRRSAVSRDWDEIKQWSDSVYMPYLVRPTDRALMPAASMYSAKIADITLTRFAYGVPVAIGEFAPESGNVLVLTTIRGATRHSVAHGRSADVTSGGTFVVDCSRVDYRFEADPEHLQLNLTIPHQLLADLALRWWGSVPDDRLWRHKCVIGGPGTTWLALMEYVVRTLAEAPDRVADGRVGINLQEMIAAQLLTDWTTRAGTELGPPTALHAPGYVRRAVRYIDENARDLPTASEIALAAGVSVRALSGAFRRYLDTTPRDYLREQRLQGVRRELLAGRSSTVAEAAGAWGYVNLGMFAAAYRRRFGENPAQTVRGAQL
ncbi:AraC family transcriptional regulator [Rhodococcus daqingensis]|uniref:AraC family transcriptional regulator n=1 Tax=Rhodococcus daqingensis TaxID=2479363 RepID=A0ABW2S1M1_9NOCA